MSQQNQQTTDQSTQQLSTNTVVTTAKSKFTSRKFILSIVGCIVGILGMIGCNDNVVAMCAFIALEALCIIAYVLTEGKIDASSVQMSTTLLTQIMSMVEQLKSGNDHVTIPGNDNAVADDILPTLKE